MLAFLFSFLRLIVRIYLVDSRFAIIYLKNDIKSKRLE